MRKVLPFVFALVLLVTFKSESMAAVVKINNDGTATLNVLAYQDSSEDGNSFEIKSPHQEVNGNLAIVSLSKTGDSKYNLAVNSGGVSQNLYIENTDSEIVEIEERPKIKKMSIGIEGEKFTLKQNEITAVTEYPLTVNSETAEMSVDTNEGQRNLSIYPYDAVETLTKSKLITQVKDNKVEILEEESKLIYKIEGEKVFTILNFYDYKVPLTARVSATTGEILEIDTPGWLRFVNVFFS